MATRVCKHLADVFDMCAAGENIKERTKISQWKHLLRCVKHTIHISACLYGIKMYPEHIFSPASLEKKTGGEIDNYCPVDTCVNFKIVEE